MFTVKIITNVDLIEEKPFVMKGSTVYEEDFDNLHDIRIDEMWGKDYYVEIINNENQTKLVLE